MKSLLSSALKPILSTQTQRFLILLIGMVALMAILGDGPVSSRSLVGVAVFVAAGILIYQSQLNSSKSNLEKAIKQELAAQKSAALAAHKQKALVRQSKTQRKVAPLQVPQVTDEELRSSTIMMKSPTMATPIHEQSMLPTCAFMFNINSKKPSTLIMPDMASLNSFILVPKELSQFFNQSTAQVMDHGNDIKVLRPVDDSYKKSLKQMALNETKNILDNGSLILPINFVSDN